MRVSMAGLLGQGRELLRHGPTLSRFVASRSKAAHSEGGVAGVEGTPAGPDVGAGKCRLPIRSRPSTGEARMSTAPRRPGPTGRRHAGQDPDRAVRRPALKGRIVRGVAQPLTRPSWG